MREEIGPIYGVKLCGKVAIGGGMFQEMPNRADLDSAMPRNSRLVAGYEVLLAVIESHKKQARIQELKIYELESWNKEGPRTVDGALICPGMTVYGVFTADAEMRRGAPLPTGRQIIKSIKDITVQVQGFDDQFAPNCFYLSEEAAYKAQGFKK